jgi:lipopolysaccharide/colanic/teichoic acid biosynthesis glycosyltransferase
MRIKCLFDIVVAIVALLLFAPVFLVAALLIVLDTRGAILYKARRIGWGGRPFQLYTFRTLPVDAALRSTSSSKDSPPLTRAGQLLHSVHLDGLPQLINVLKGDMSLIGPHPEAPEYVRFERPIWRQVLAMRPGVFGLAQLSFAFGEIVLLDNQATLDRDSCCGYCPSSYIWIYATF